MKRRKHPFVTVLSPMLVIASLLSCRANREVQAPVAASAAPTSQPHSPSDLRPPETFVEGDQAIDRSLAAPQDPSAQRGLAKPIEATSELAKGNIHSGPLAPGGAATPASNALAKAAGLYVEAQSLEESHAFPQAVAAYDRLLAMNPDYADAVARRATLLELVGLADSFYVSAMDADSAEDRLLYLRQLQQFWPEYRDVEQQLEELKQASAKALLEQAKAKGAKGPE